MHQSSKSSLALNHQATSILLGQRELGFSPKSNSWEEKTEGHYEMDEELRQKGHVEFPWRWIRGAIVGGQLRAGQMDQPGE